MSSADAPNPRMGKPLVAALVSGALVLAAGLTYLFAFGGDQSDAAVVANKNYAIYKDDHVMGNPGAPVVLIEYAAPACPFCAKFYLEELPNLKKKYIDTGKVLFVFRAFPISPVDGAVESVGRSLAKERYFDFIRHMYANQRTWDWEYGVQDVRGGLTKTFAKIGIGAKQFDDALKNTEVQTAINRIAQDGVTRYGINATPTFVINGEVMLSSRDIHQRMQAKIDSLLAGRK